MEVLQEISVSTTIPDLLHATLGLGFLIGGGWMLYRWKRTPRPGFVSTSAADKMARLPPGAKQVMDADRLLQPHAALS